MSAHPSLDPAALARLGILQGTQALLPAEGVLGLGWPELERALPDRGLPRGVVEIAASPRVASPRGRSPGGVRGGATSIALAAVGAVHASSREAWCAWVTPAAGADGAAQPSLYAPALVQAGVDLARLLVLRPSPDALARTVVKAAASGAFTLLVVDLPHRQGLGARRNADEALVVRKLALAAEESGTTSLLLTSALAPRVAPWPVTMRIEVERRPDALALRVAKHRRGPASSQHVVRLRDLALAPFGVTERGAGEASVVALPRRQAG